MITYLNKDVKNRITTVLGVAMSAYVIYVAFKGAPVPMMAHRAIFTAVMLVMYFTSLKPLGESITARTIDGILVLFSIVSNGYIALYYDRILRAAGGAYLNDIELALGFILILVCLEAARRASLPFFIICSIGVLYTFTGPYLPGLLYHPGLAYYRIVYMVAFTSEGIFGVGVSIGASLMFMFMLFGSTMDITGVGEFFMRFANSTVGGLRGGPGKAAMVGSSLIGSIMGNATANVVVTGTFSIPLMIKTGFKRKVAGAVECYASEGGQYLPPVMGAAAFIMAQITRIPYSTIVISAFIPAIIYYVIGFMMVDLEAVKTDLKGIPKELREPTLKILKKQGHYLLPIIAVIYTIVILKMTPVYAAMLGVVVTLAVTQLTPPFKGVAEITKISIKALDAGSRSVADLMGLLVGIGLVQQAFTVTGLGGRIATILVQLSRGNLLLLLIIGFMAALILGMGMPTPVAYLLVALFIAPAFVDLGVPVLAAHMFLFYIAVKSASTSSGRNSINDCGKDRPGRLVGDSHTVFDLQHTRFYAGGDFCLSSGTVIARGQLF
jgi:TRAP transporter 4TM/12TM fusion protein